MCVCVSSLLFFFVSSFFSTAEAITSWMAPIDSYIKGRQQKKKSPSIGDGKGLGGRQMTKDSLSPIKPPFSYPPLNSLHCPFLKSYKHPIVRGLFWHTHTPVCFFKQLIGFVLLLALKQWWRRWHITSIHTHTHTHWPRLCSSDVSAWPNVRPVVDSPGSAVGWWAVAGHCCCSRRWLLNKNKRKKS